MMIRQKRKRQRIFVGKNLIAGAKLLYYTVIVLDKSLVRGICGKLRYLHLGKLITTENSKVQ